VSTLRPWRRGRTWITAPIVAAVVLLGPNLSAGATYPGANGEIVYLDSGTFRAVQPDGSNDRAYVPIHFPQDLSFSLDGSHAIVANYGKLRARIVLVDLVAHTRTPVLRTGHAPTPAIASVALSPDGSSVVFCDGIPHGNLWTVAIDGTALTEIAKGYCFGDWSVNDRIVASKTRSDGERIVATMDPDGGNKQVIVALPPLRRAWSYYFDLRPRWSPDGTAVVFGAQRNRAYPEIWSVDSDGSNLQNLTHTTRSEFDPVFSPDGLHIVYARRTHIYPNGLWMMDSVGTNQAELLVRPSGQEHPLAWRPT
jgi:Tol biopolymer transport system component